MGCLCMMYYLVFIYMCGYVQVEALQNLALGKQAYQTDTSTAVLSAGAENAVDGNTNGWMAIGSCTHTQTKINVWWEVDLGTLCYIDRVTIFNRWGKYSYRLTDVELYVGLERNDEDYTLKGFHEGQIGENYTFHMESPTYGRWVKVTRKRDIDYEYLQLCEVMVFGEVAQDTHYFIQFRYVSGQIGTGAELDNVQTNSVTKCCVLCRLTVNCYATNYNIRTGACSTLHGRTSEQDSTGETKFFKLP